MCTTPPNFPRWLFVGDSLTATGAFDWPAKLAPFAPGITFTNLAVGGSQSAAILGQWNTGRQAIPSKVFVLGGINDIRASATAASAYANLAQIYARAVAQHCTVIALPTSPFGNAAGWTAGQQTEMLALRASIIADPNVSTVVDLYDPFGEPGAPEDLAAIYDSGDGLHQNTAGTTLIMNLVKTALGQ